MSNYCILNPIQRSTIVNGSRTIGNGGQEVTDGGTTYGCHAMGSLYVNTGKWYWEVMLVSTSGSDYAQIGIIDAEQTEMQSGAGTSNCIGYVGNGYSTDFSWSSGWTGTGNTASAGATYTSGDVIGVALDCDNATVEFFKNGATQFTISGWSMTGRKLTPAVGDGANAYSHRFDCNFGQYPFRYTPPTGFKQLKVDNIPTTTNFNSSLGETPQKHFETILYSGTGAVQSVSSLGFQPDLVWIKERGSISSHYIVDTVRGSGSGDSFNPIDITSTAASTYENLNSHVTAINSNGFSLGNNSDTTFYVNRSGQNYKAFCWKAGGVTTADNSAGAGNVPTSGSVMIDGVASTSALAGSNPAIRLSANTKAGFSIVKYAGSASTTTVAHGLSSAPQFIMIKNLNGGFNLPCYHHKLGNAAYLLWNSTGTKSTGQSDWGSTTPTNTVFTLGGNEGRDSRAGENFIAYCFHEVPGFSKIGRWYNVSSGSGQFIECGFEPAYILMKNDDNAEQWYIIDNKSNPFNKGIGQLQTMTTGTNIEGNPNSAAGVDIVSNGFKIRSSNTASGEISFAGRNYIFIAFAENPQKFGLGKA